MVCAKIGGTRYGVSMALKTTLQQLEEVQAAITEVMTSQAQRGPSGSVERPQLDALAKREEILLARYYRETGKSMASVVYVVRRD
jgi:hypothetical protein